jgi:hypothetical protein
VVWAWRALVVIVDIFSAALYGAGIVEEFSDVGVLLCQQGSGKVRQHRCKELVGAVSLRGFGFMPKGADAMVVFCSISSTKSSKVNDRVSAAYSRMDQKIGRSSWERV